jgi:hypothetical protein
MPITKKVLSYSTMRKSAHPCPYGERGISWSNVAAGLRFPPMRALARWIEGALGGSTLS